MPAGYRIVFERRLVTERLQVAPDALLQHNGPTIRRPVGESGVVIDGSHVLAQDHLCRRMGPRPHAVADNRERTAKSGEAVAPFLTGAR
jgi:hypothetical protein